MQKILGEALAHWSSWSWGGFYVSVLKSIASMSLLFRHAKMRVFDVVAGAPGKSGEAAGKNAHVLAYRPPWSVPHRPWLLP